MLEEQMDKVVNGLMLIVPAILLLRWFLVRKAGSPEDMAKYRMAELQHKLERGDIDQATYDRLVSNITVE